MNTKTFKKKLIGAIEKSGEFVTDTIDMEELVASEKKMGFDDIVLVSGKSHTEIFTLSISKI